MNVCVINSKQPGIITHAIIYGVGAAEDPSGKSGLAHLVEHMMFRGTQSTPNFSTVIENLGGLYNAMTSSYFTGYYEVINQKDLKLIMQLEADRMKKLDIKNENFVAEKKIVAEERKMRIDSSPYSRMKEQISSVFFKKDHSWQVAGWSDDIESITLYDVKRMYNWYYQPKNATIVVLGDIDKDTVIEWANKYYVNESIVENSDDRSQNPSQTKKINRKILAEPQHAAETIITMRDKQLKVPHLEIWYKAPSAAQDIRSSLALTIASVALSQGKTSILYKKLVLEEQKALAVNAYYSPLSMSDTSFVISAHSTNEEYLNDVVCSINDTIEYFSKNDLYQHDFEKAKEIIKSHFIYELEDAPNAAILYGSALVMGIPINYIDRFSESIDSITLEEVRESFRKFLSLQSNDKKTIGFLLREE